MSKKRKKKKTLILAVDVGNKNRSDWMVKAMQMQISDWFKRNDTILPSEDVIIMPTSGEMKIYWLEGDPEDVRDIEKIEEIKDRIKPVLEVAMGIKADPDKKFKHPKVAAPNENKLKKAAQDLYNLRRQGPPKPRIITP